MGPVNCLSDQWLVVLAAISSFVLWMTPHAAASELVDLQPLTERILMLHFNDGHVQHHQRGEPRSAEKVFTDPLDVVAASRLETYAVASADDPAYREKKLPNIRRSQEQRHGLRLVCGQVGKRAGGQLAS